MEERIREFIADYIPKRITKETRYKLQYELENHIYERIDYYTEIGYSEEESLEKALKDFGDDEETKEQIKKEMSEIHRPFTLADLFSISIPITVAIIFFGGIALNFLFRFIDIKNLVIIPLIIWLIILVLNRIKKLHHILKSIFAFILVVPYFLLMSNAYFFFQTHFYTIYDKNEAFSSYCEFTIDEETNEQYLDWLLPDSDKINNPIDANHFSIIEDSPFSNPSYFTWIFKYTPTEYNKIKKTLENTIEYRDKFITDDGAWVDDEYIPRYIKADCNFNVYGFEFKTIYTPNEEDIYYDENIDCEEFDFWSMIGTNDKTHEIAFIYLTPAHFTPSFDEDFIKEDCGWRYYYIKKWFNDL